MSYIQGNWIVVPKGTRLVGTKGFSDETRRDQTVEVTEDAAERVEHWSGFISAARLVSLEADIRALGIYASDEAKNLVLDSYRNLVKAKLGLESLVTVTWGDGGQVAFAEHVTAGEAPQRNRVARDRVNKRQQMVVGSRWTFTQDVDVLALIKGTREGVIYSAKAGQEFEIVGKPQTWYPGISQQGNGQVAILRVDGEDDDRGWPIHSIAPYIQDSLLPVVASYVLRDNATGLFYQDVDEQGNIVYVQDFMKAQNYASDREARVDILNNTGYYNVKGQKRWDLPTTWELVKFNMLNQKEVSVVVGLHDWYRDKTATVEEAIND